MIKNTKESYGIISKIFHWVIGISIIALIIVGFTMASLDASPLKWRLYSMHKASGVVVLMLVIARICWKFTNQYVSPEKNTPKILVHAAHLGHFLLYVFMLMMPISGIFMSYFGGHDISVFNLFTIHAGEKNPDIAKFFHQMHSIGGWGFAILVVVHVLAAFFHHFILRDNSLNRMLK